MTATSTDSSMATRVLRGLLAGIVAGTVASYAMDRFQAVVTNLSSDGNSSDPEPATEQAADAMAHAVGAAIHDQDKPLAGQAVHYLLGIALGAAYGVAAEFRPSVTAGHGAAFAFGTATLLDEAAVPAVGLGDLPWKADVATHLYGYASHLVFGATTEWVRREVRATLAD